MPLYSNSKICDNLLRLYKSSLNGDSINMFFSPKLLLRFEVLMSGGFVLLYCCWILKCWAYLSCNYIGGSPFFRDDTRLRALRFLDHMLVRINFFFPLDLVSSCKVTLWDNYKFDLFFRNEITCKSQSFWKHCQKCGRILTCVCCGIRFDYLYYLLV